jgi:hypothetical protein
MEIGSSGFEFELDMLIAARHHVLVEDGHTTLYEPAIHLPTSTAVRLHAGVFVFLRLTALDGHVRCRQTDFLAAFFLGPALRPSQVAGARATLVQLPRGAAAVFLSHERHGSSCPLPAAGGASGAASTR